MPTVQKLRLLAQLKMENGLQETLDLVPDSLKTERSQPPEYRPQRLQSFPTPARLPGSPCGHGKSCLTRRPHVHFPQANPRDASR
mgnify:CR=1 FL=1